MTKMSFLFYVGPDDLRIGDRGNIVRRPTYISRSRWMAYWQHASITGFKLESVSRFLTGTRVQERNKK